MATTFDITNAVDVGAVSDFIPEMWSDEVIATYKANLVLAGLVTKLNHRGKKGDTIHLPGHARGAASAKVANNVVTLIAGSDSTQPFSINKHYEYSRLIEDIVEVQALDSLRRFYTDDAGYALAKQVDTDLGVLAADFQAGAGDQTYPNAVGGADGATAYVDGAGTPASATDIADIGVRKVIQTLDDLDTPQRGRVWVVCPSQRNALLGIARFTETQFVGEVGAGNSIRNGFIGNLYGDPVFITTNLDTPTAGTGVRACMYFQKEALLLIEQMSVRSQTQYKQEYLADLYTADTLYGTGTPRNANGVAVMVPVA